ncbi:hypothetical protein EDB81DRAFT_118956 [Dactylonectria macrodidyma]|uniref:Uncharacterized protein n=1 Tax=Dactylonectria macrodidyma TaxID=307937 RepID=A0A9P9IUG1_9HYPO|nr:hypothetical protein EDB81DRAFT_118956 [Dactylonectria macrodidyma]
MQTWIVERPQNGSKRSSKPAEQVGKEIGFFLNGLPQGEADWNDYPYDGDFQSMVRSITLEDLDPRQRAKMDLRKRLTELARRIATAPRDPNQLQVAVFVSASVVANKHGVEISDNNPKCSLDANLANRQSKILRYILLLDVLEVYMGDCAYEIPLRRKPFMNVSFTEQHFCILMGILEQDRNVPCIPSRGRCSRYLRIPDLVNRLLHGIIRPLLQARFAPSILQAARERFTINALDIVVADETSHR